MRKLTSVLELAAVLTLGMVVDHSWATAGPAEIVANPQFSRYNTEITYGASLDRLKGGRPVVGTEQSSTPEWVVSFHIEHAPIYSRKRPDLILPVEIGAEDFLHHRTETTKTVYLVSHYGLSDERPSDYYASGNKAELFVKQHLLWHDYSVGGTTAEGLNDAFPHLDGERNEHMFSYRSLFPVSAGYESSWLRIDSAEKKIKKVDLFGNLELRFRGAETRHSDVMPGSNDLQFDLSDTLRFLDDEGNFQLADARWALRYYYILRKMVEKELKQANGVDPSSQHKRGWNMYGSMQLFGRKELGNMISDLSITSAYLTF